MIGGELPTALRPRGGASRLGSCAHEDAGWKYVCALSLVFWLSLGAVVAGYAWNRTLPVPRADELAAQLPATFSPLAGLSPAELAAKGLFGLGGAMLCLLMPWYLAAGGALLRHTLLAACGREELARVERETSDSQQRDVSYAFVTPRGALRRGRASVPLHLHGEDGADATFAVRYLPWAPWVSHPRDAVWFRPRR